MENSRSTVTIAVVIPLFNKEDAIESTLSSVLGQTRLPDELIIVDDGSTDRSSSIAEAALSRADPSTAWRVVPQQNAGEGAARNRGISEARSEYVAFIDADDEWLPTHLAEIEKLALSFPSASVLSTRTSRRDPSGAVIPLPSALGTEFFGIVERPIDAYRRGLGILHSSSVAVRRDVLDRAGGFQVGAPMGADVLLWLRLGLTETFAHSGSPLSVWRYEYSDVGSRRSTVPAQLHHFFETDEGRRHLPNSDLVKFLASNLILHIGVFSMIGNTEIRSRFRQMARWLPISFRLKFLAASLVPASGYRAFAWWRRFTRELQFRRRTGQKAHQ